MRSHLVFILLTWVGAIASQSTFVDSVLHSTDQLSSKARVEQLYQIAKTHSDVDLREAQTVIEQTLMLAMSLRDDRLTLDCLWLLGDIYSRYPNFSATDSVNRVALTVAERMGDDSLIARARLRIGNELSYTGKYTESNAELDKVITLAAKSKDTLIHARALMIKGLNLDNVSAYEPALDYYYRSLDLFKQIEDQFRVGIVTTNIGMVFLDLKRHEEALTEFEKAAKISEEVNDEEGVMANLINIGVVHQRLGNYDQATENFNKALVMAREMQSWFDIALLHANLGTAAMQQGRYVEAEKLIQRACNLRDSLGFRKHLSQSKNSLSEVLKHLGRYDEALARAREAGLIAEEYEDLTQLSASYKNLSESFFEKGDIANAYVNLVKHKQLSDSVFSQQSDQAISNLRIQYETTEKEHQISELSAENQRRKTLQSIYLLLTILIVIAAASLIYALYIRRSRDKMLLAKEIEMHELQNSFFANISHEFRTPLTLILGPVHNLRKQFASMKEDQPLRIIQKNAERLLFLINQILDLTKFDQKVLQLKREDFNLNHMIQGICSSFDSLAEERSIHYSYEIPFKSLFVNGDIRRLEIVLINLISNAFKFTPDKGAISVTAQASGASILIHVSDSGTGISAERLPKIFDRYYHDDRDAHSDFEGAGIGLALSKNIVELHDGTLTVKSTVNQGSIFTICLPALSHIPEQITPYIEQVYPTEKGEASAQYVTAADSDKPILLLVEDRTDMREYVSSLLQDKYQVVEAADAFEGREKAFEIIPDVVISDVMMPKKSGLALCAELKMDVRTSHIPVLLLTAKAAPEDRLSGLETEADVYLTKPFIPQELELHLRNLIASRQKVRAFYESHRKVEPAKMAFNSVDQQFLEALNSHLEQHFSDESFSVEQLAGLMYLSRSQLHRKLSALTGQAPNQVIRRYRLTKAFDMISGNAATIAEISYQCGFNSPAYFNKCFAEEYEATPGEIRSRFAKVSKG